MPEKYQKTILDNGLRVVSERMDWCKSVSIGVWVLAGSRNDTKKHEGISHLLEHMLFKGTGSRTAYEIATSLESLGGTLNAFTEREFTCFYALVLDDNLSEAIDVIADVIQNAILDEKDLQNEKRIVFEEIRNLEDSPEDLIQDIFIQTIFSNQSLGLPPLGSYKTIETIQRSDLKNHLQKFYTTSNILIASAGKLDHDHLVDSVSKCFHSLSTGCPSTQDPFRMGTEQFKKIRSPIKQTHICTGVAAYSYQDPKKFPLLILNSILGGGMSSRLFQNLRENKGLAYSVYSFVDLWSDTGLFGVYTGTSPKNYKKATELIEEEFCTLCDKKVPQDEFDRTKSQLTRNLILVLEDSTSRMNRLARIEAYTQEVISVNDVISQIESVSQDDVQSVAQELLKHQKRYTTILEPK